MTHDLASRLRSLAACPTPSVFGEKARMMQKFMCLAELCQGLTGKVVPDAVLCPVERLIHCLGGVPQKAVEDTLCAMEIMLR